jgi:hypothetical protein
MRRRARRLNADPDEVQMKLAVLSNSQIDVEELNKPRQSITWLLARPVVPAT